MAARREESPPQPLRPTVIARAQAYERVALEEIFDRTYGPVYDLAAAVAGDAGNPDQLVWQAYIRALDQIDHCPAWAGGVEAWLLRITAIVAGARAGGDPGREDLRSALTRLPGDLHEVLALRLVAGLEAAQLARVSGRSLAKVQSLQLRGLRELRSQTGSRQLWTIDPESADQALDSVLDGTPVASDRESLPGDADQLLGLAARLRSLPRPHAGHEARTLARAGFLAESDRRRTLWFQHHREPATKPVDGRRVNRHRFAHAVGTGTALLLAMVLALVVGVVAAALASFSEPDSFLYPLKRADESALLALTRDPAAHADLEVKLSQTRREEAEAMAASRKPGLAVRAMSDHYQELRVAASGLAQSPTRGPKWVGARNRFETEASRGGGPVIRELESSGFKAQATQVQGQEDAFQVDHKAYDKLLGTAPAHPGSTGTPAGAPATSPPAGSVPHS